MAVSSLYETFTKRSRLDIACGADDQSSAFAVWHYNEAIRLLRTTTDRALILFICVLFICVELLRNNSKDAVEHCRHGINILNEVRSESDFIKNHVQPAIRNLSIVPYLYGADPHSFPTLGEPAPATKYNFRNISEAHQSLVCVLVRVVRFARCLTEPRLEPGRNGPDPGTEWTQQDIVEDMDAWLEGLRHFTGYIYVPAGPEERDICRLLEMRWTVGKVMLLTCRSNNGRAYDEHFEKFRTIVELAIPAAAAATASAATASAGKRKPGYCTERHPLELGFTSLLAFVVMKCHIFELRLAAWKLMNKLHRPNDNIWSEDVTIVLGRRIMELEHHVNLDDLKLDDDDDISEIGEGDPALVQKERIVNFSANFANNEFPRRNVRFNFLIKEGQSKEYVVEDDWISVKSRPKTQLLEEESEWTWKGHC
ncbi:Aspercryptin biosynthesis cluster-specific transcription regulator atnN [Colletotrichum viniferum]|nr:Aspercryptin biosynthesis cluster-specific transcription regulator atnN [Colletotrichum viniferum]